MTHNEVLVTQFPTGWKVEVEVGTEGEARYLGSVLRDRVGHDKGPDWRAMYEGHMELHDDDIDGGLSLLQAAEGGQVDAREMGDDE